MFGFLVSKNERNRCDAGRNLHGIIRWFVCGMQTNNKDMKKDRKRNRLVYYEKRPASPTLETVGIGFLCIDLIYNTILVSLLVFFFISLRQTTRPRNSTSGVVRLVICLQNSKTIHINGKRYAIATSLISSWNHFPTTNNNTAATTKSSSTSC